EAAFSVEAGIDGSSNEVCVGETVTFNDASTFALGDIVNWEWTFGSDATPSTATGAGPHDVSYGNPGVKTVVLTVESEKGCQVTEIDVPISVVCCEFDVDIMADIMDVNCPDDMNGAIDLTIDGEFPPYAFNWSNNETTEDISGLTAGEYTVEITDEATCDTTLTFTVAVPDSLRFNIEIQKPTCDGGTDGSITLRPTGGTAPYEFDFGNGFSSENILTNIPQGDYSATIRDANGCEETMMIEVRELELELDPSVQSITPPSCFGDSDASILVQINNGLPPYQYDFNDGNGFGNSNERMGLSSGTYTVNVMDANLCEGSFEFIVEDPALLEITATAENISCFGEQDGRVSTATTGGTGSYSYQWSTGSDARIISELNAGEYIVTVTDENNCVAFDTVTIIEPNRLDAEIVEVIDALCAGGNSGTIIAAGVGGTGPFTYSTDGFIFQESNNLAGLPTGSYTITVKDARECTATVDAFISEPENLIVDLGEDLSLNLGEDARLNAQVSPPDREVTYLFTGTDSLSCLDCPNPTVFPLETATFNVTVTDNNGCSATDAIRIQVAKPRPVYIPTAFSPNGDGANDHFYLFADNSASEIISLRIYDRWGELMYEGLNVPFGDEQLGWDGNFLGKPMKPAIFAYVAEVAFIDGEVRIYDGDVALLR
ncbi:MAG: PKD domain-containing protein, partial [Saprospiraceae bacterium]